MREALDHSYGVGDNYGTHGTSNEAFDIALTRALLNRRTAGHFDPHARLRDLDWDGVAAEVLFHGSQNDECFPFVGMRDFSLTYNQLDHELVAVAYRMYNRWMADFKSVAPERFIGLCYLPMWDVDLAIAEMEFAANAGITAVNFPAPKAGIKEYDDPVWEPFWTACDDLGMTLATHAGVPQWELHGPQRNSVQFYEVAGWPARRGMPRMIFGGVFERHPGLNLVLTEQSRGWWQLEMRALDYTYGIPTDDLKAQMPLPPSEYMKRNIYLGASFMPPAEVDEARSAGYMDRILWGSDYPHGEGTYKYPEFDGEESMTRQCIRWAFSDCPPDMAKAMLGETAVKVYHLDRPALEKVAARIGPTMQEIAQPLTHRPRGWHDDIYGCGVRDRLNL
jgi:predicted TIM-barrel fold metal-dependent hydrolase